MKFKIITDKPGRLRIKVGKYAFSTEAAYGLEQLLIQRSEVLNASVNPVNGSILVLYRCDDDSSEAHLNRKETDKCAEESQKAHLNQAEACRRDDESRKSHPDQAKISDCGGQLPEKAKENNIRRDIIRLLKELKFSEIPDGAPTDEQEMAAENHMFYMAVAKDVATHFARKWFLPMPFRTAWTVLKSLRFFRKGAAALLSGNLNVDVLDASSIACAFIQKDPATASSIMLLLKISERLEEHTHRQTVKALEDSLAMQVEQVWLVTPDCDVKVKAADIEVGDLVRVQDGAVIPFDGTIFKGEAFVNESSLTGESAAVRRIKDHSVYAGTVIEEGSIVIRVTKKAGDGRIHDIAGMIDESERLKAGVQSKAEKLADSIVPFSFAAAAATLLLTGNPTKAMSALMVDYSCALKLSIPICVISAMREAADKKILVKGGKFLENFASADTIIFDKTGTLTSASPKVTKVIPMNGYSRDEILRNAACIEEHFPHSVARAIVRAAAEEGLGHAEEHSTVEYVVAHGISTKLHEQNAKIGSAHYIFEDEKIPYTDEVKELEEAEMSGLTVIYFAIDGKVAGLIGIEDPPRDDAADVVEKLRKSGFRHVIMMTGDGQAAADRAAKIIGIDEYRAQVLPEDKAELVHRLKAEGRRVVMVGDGINDSPALAAADVSVAMRDSSDLAKQVADVTLLSEELSDLLLLREMSSALIKRTSVNYKFILRFNTLLMAFGISGVMQPSSTAMLHNLSTMALSLASTRPYVDVQSDEPGTV